MSTQQELKQQGNIYFQNNNFEKAIEFYTLAIEKDAFCDEAAPILSNRSLCYYNIGKYKEAYEDGGCCCGIRPDWAKGFARRGAAAEELKEWQIALESYEEYLKLDTSDEMGIAMKKNRVRKFVNEIEKKKQEREKELQRIDEDLAGMKDEKKQMLSYCVLVMGGLQMDISKIELAVQHGVDLSRKWIIDKRLGPRAFSNALFAEAEKIYDSDKNWYQLKTGASHASLQVSYERSKADDSQFEQTSLLSKQRDYFDRLLDLVDKQHKKYNPPVKMMLFELNTLLTAGNDFPFRTDVFLLLNTKKGKDFFVGDTMNMKQWQLQLVQSTLAAGNTLNQDPSTITKKDLSEEKRSVPPTGAHLRSLLECLEMGLQGISAQDLNAKRKLCRGFDESGNTIETDVTFIELVVAMEPVAELLEFFLSRGVDPNTDSTDHAATNHHSVFDTVLQHCHHSCIRVFLSHGAKISTELMPKWILEHPVYTGLAAAPASSTMLLPLPANYPYLWRNMALRGRDENIDETAVRVLFDAMTEQNISFIGFLSTKESIVVFTPLIWAIDNTSHLKFIEILLKVRPKLLNTPTPRGMWRENENNFTSVRYPVAHLVDRLLSCDKDCRMDYFKSVMALMFDVSGFAYDEFAAYQSEKCSMSLPEYIEELLRSIPKTNKKTNDPASKQRSKQLKEQLKEVQNFCINYTNKKKTCNQEE